MRSFLVIVGAILGLQVIGAVDKKVVCYLGSWATYRPGAGKFEIEDIDVGLCSHLVYAFVGLIGSDVKILDDYQDLTEQGGKGGFKRFNALRVKNPTIKTLVAIGGWNEKSKNYSMMAANPNFRMHFVKNVVTFVKTHGFDGFDVDWEYPAKRGGSDHDKVNFSFLLRELRSEFDKEGLLLTAAVSATKDSAHDSYEIAEISKYLHFIHLMTYDFHGSVDKRTGMNAPLYCSAADSDSNKQLTVNFSVNYWLSEGAPPEKLILGIATYGRSFTLQNPDDYGVGAKATGPGPAGPYTGAAGSLGYNEICELQDRQEWTTIYDEERCVPYTYRDFQWVGYDNERSVKEKAKYIMKMGLAGAMIWSMETDDFRGICGEKYVLTKTINRVFGREFDSNDLVPSISGSNTIRYSPSEIIFHALNFILCLNFIFN